jgi:hypothetical protein
MFAWLMFSPCQDECLVEWINPIYLDEGVVSHIRERFEDESEIELQDFLLVSTDNCSLQTRQLWEFVSTNLLTKLYYKLQLHMRFSKGSKKELCGTPMFHLTFVTRGWQAIHKVIRVDWNMLSLARYGVSRSIFNRLSLVQSIFCI